MWPSNKTMKNTMPDIFKESYNACRGIIDCTEFRTDPLPIRESSFFTYYKKSFTLKLLVCCTPSGFISFVPKALRQNYRCSNYQPINHFSTEEVVETKKISKVRIHIERIMQRIRTYNILSKFTIKMLPYADDIILYSCAAL